MTEQTTDEQHFPGLADLTADFSALRIEASADRPDRVVAAMDRPGVRNAIDQTMVYEFHALCGWPSPVAVRAMAARAILRVERGATRQIGDTGGRKRYGIGGYQGLAERPRGGCHLVSGRLRSDRGLESLRVANELRPCRGGW